MGSEMCIRDRYYFELNDDDDVKVKLLWSTNRFHFTVYGKITPVDNNVNLDVFKTWRKRTKDALETSITYKGRFYKVLCLYWEVL